MTISEISGMLDAAIKDISTSASKLDEAKKQYEIASEYNTNAIQKANLLRNQLNEELDKVLPNQGSRIRGVA